MRTTLSALLLLLASPSACGPRPTPAPLPPPPPAPLAAPPALPAPSAAPSAAVPPPPPTTPPLTADGQGVLALEEPIAFEPDTAILAAASEPHLRRVVAYLKTNPRVGRLRIEAHTAGKGPKATKIALSKERAMAVAQWLVGMGVTCDRLLPVGFGNARPLVEPERSADDEAKNQRVVFVEAVIDGKPRGGAPIDGGPPAVIAGNPCD